MARARRASLQGGLLAALLLVGLTGCASGPSAQERVCTARAEMSAAYQTLITDVKALDFGAAKDDVATLKTAADDLVAAERDLSADKQAQMQPDLDRLTAALADLEQAGNLQELGASLDTAAAALRAAMDTAMTSANCS